MQPENEESLRLPDYLDFSFVRTVSSGWADWFESPDLFFLEGGSVCVDFKAESFRSEVTELAVDKANGPAAFHLVLSDYISTAVHGVSVCVAVQTVHNYVWKRKIVVNFSRKKGAKRKKFN